MDLRMSIQTVLAGGLVAVRVGIVILYITSAWWDRVNGTLGGFGGLERFGGAIVMLGVCAKG